MTILQWCCCSIAMFGTFARLTAVREIQYMTLVISNLGAVYMSRASPAKRADSILSRLMVA